MKLSISFTFPSTTLYTHLIVVYTVTAATRLIRLSVPHAKEWSNVVDSIVIRDNKMP